MKKKEFVQRVTDALREKDIKKPIVVPKQVLHISDNTGKHKDFIFERLDRRVIYTVNDVDAILTACLHELERILSEGESVSIYGYGEVGVKKRAARMVKAPLSDESIMVDDRLVPKCTFGTALKAAARIYEMKLKEGGHNIPINLPEEEDEDLDGED